MQRLTVVPNLIDPVLAAIEAGSVADAGRLARLYTESAGADLVGRLETKSDAA